MKRPEFMRSYPLLDISVRAGGRTVTAYAATFDDPYEVYDNEGHYMESLDRASFNRTTSADHFRAQCLFNHGMTIYHTPSERFSMPLGTPVEVRADAKGLVTVTDYAKTDLADEVLELIGDGAIRSQSFRGPILRSKVVGKIGALRHISRLELGLRDYGPCTYAVNDGAAILGVRAGDVTESEMSADLRQAVIDKVAPGSDTYSVWIADYSIDGDLWVVYEFSANCYKLGYSVAADGTVTLVGDPVEVERKTEYVPVDQSARSAPSGLTVPTVIIPAAPEASAMHDLELLELRQAQRRRR